MTLDIPLIISIIIIACTIWCLFRYGPAIRYEEDDE